MFTDFLIPVFRQHADSDAVVWKDRACTYGRLRELINHWRGRMDEEQIRPGSVVVLEADFSPNAVALFLVLLDRQCVLVPLTSAVESKRDGLIQTAQGEILVQINGDDQVSITPLNRRADHPIYAELRRREHPGLVLFSSGSTGESKAAVHDLVGLLDKFRTRRHRLRAISFLLYDHIGGVNTMLYTLSNGGCLVTVQARSPDGVLEVVQKHRVDLLPTSPTFINLMLLSEAGSRWDLSALKTVTYGTEPMPESTLKRFHRQFPHVRLVQTYGLSEVGILRSKSRSSDSLWVKVGGEGFQTRVVNGILHVKAASAMLGYLNAPSPFSEDGWLITGDVVEQDGEYVRFLGRQSEIINVGGEKVFPGEVESIIQELDNVADVTVHGQKNPITGQIVCARVSLKEDESPKSLRLRLRLFCQGRLEPFKIPVKVEIVEGLQHGARFKTDATGGLRLVRDKIPCMKRSSGPRGSGSHSRCSTTLMGRPWRMWPPSTNS